MTASKRKGSAWERQVCEYLRAEGLNVERRVQAGANDRGDVAGIPGWVVECKATKAIDLAQGMKETLKEQQTAKVPFHALVVKKRNAGAGDAYAVMTLEQLRRIILQP